MQVRHPVLTLSAHLLFAYAVHAQALPVQGQPATGGSYDFAYRILGDRRVAPVQVFDDGRHTYMQFRTGQTVPAIFGVGQQGERLLAHVSKGGYVVVEGTAREYSMRIGLVGAQAQYLGKAPRVAASSGDAAIPDLSAEIGFDAGIQAGAQRRASPSATYAAVAPVAPRPSRPMVTFDALRSDQNMRKTLSRWATAAGWVFEAEHWTVDVDIPLAGTASLGSDFKSAVRELLAATELSVRPLQPCFYSNQVLRVLPLSEPCNRTAAAAAH